MTRLSAARRRRSSGQSGESLNVTPLIDIVMVLIIFYLMVGSFIANDYVDLRLPFSTEGEPTVGAEVYTVNVLAEDASAVAARAASGAAVAPGAGGSARVRILTGGREIDAPTLTREVVERRAVEPGLIVQLRAQRDLPYAAVEPVVRALSRAGVTNLRLVTERAP